MKNLHFNTIALLLVGALFIESGCGNSNLFDLSDEEIDALVNSRIEEALAEESDITDAQEDVTDDVLAKEETAPDATKLIIEYRDGAKDEFDNITEIRDEAYYDRGDIVSVIIPGTVTRIGDRAFSDCINLSSVIISDGVTEIGNSAFFDCTELKSIEIPGSVRTIGIYSFGNSGIETVNIEYGTEEIQEEALLYTGQKALKQSLLAF